MTGTHPPTPVLDAKGTWDAWNAWNAQDYLRQYYGRLEVDEAATLRFITAACERISPRALALVFGVGPTVHHLLPLAPHVREIHVADYLPSNLDHVRQWLHRDARAHDWRAFGHHVLQCEGHVSPSAAEVASREDLVRSKVTRCMHADAGRSWPLPGRDGQRYDVIVSCYCAESATGDRTVWRRYVNNILHLLAPGGLFITAALRRCVGYRVGPGRFPSANIDEHDLASLLVDAGAAAHQLEIEVRHVGLGSRLGYESIVLAATTLCPNQPDPSS